jgi:hypothetical protein
VHCYVVPIPLGQIGGQAWDLIQAGRSMRTAQNTSSEAIREAWNREAKQRWDGRTHGRGLSLLIVKMLALPGSLMPSSARSPTFEFWRDQNKIRGRFIGVGNGVVVARLNEDGLPVTE